MVADPFPIDQYYVENPSELFDDSIDDLIVDTDNELILEAHLQCAGYEIPLTVADEKWFGTSMLGICEGKLQKDMEGWYYTHPKYLPFPSRHVSIRGAQEDAYMVVEVRHHEQDAYMLEEVEFSRALFELYEGAVFLHQGESFIVKEVSHESKVAKVQRADVNYITSPRDVTLIEPLQTYRVSSTNNHLAEYGRVNVSVKVFDMPGFYKLRTGVVLDAVELMTPPWERQTAGFWIDLPPAISEQLKEETIDRAAAIHAAEHAFLNQFALSEDVKTDCRIAKEEDAISESKKRPPRHDRGRCGKSLRPRQVLGQPLKVGSN
ncbi:hypothetical protein NLJ89_g269 [Agrocybe chaxingu]|uniref:ATP-dependent helicase HRQ1 winged helix domain-containing protein n=1 Tax=Agrocybe chaxingu TaxID=84603 RepID=A0A9W8N2B9_9AGAR|nr:hypothetical protein NLJ89_g269 [Agrocybe chaxingu]